MGSGDWWPQGDGKMSEVQESRKEAPHVALAPQRALLLSLVDGKAGKPALGPACLGTTLAHCSLVLGPCAAASPLQASVSSPVKPDGDGSTARHTRCAPLMSAFIGCPSWPDHMLPQA